MKARAIHCTSTRPGQRGELGPQAKHREISVGLSRVGMQALELDVSLRMLLTCTARNSSFAGGEQVDMKQLPVPWKGVVGRSALCSSCLEPTHISLRCDERTWIGSTKGGAEWLKQYFRAGWEKSFLIRQIVMLLPAAGLFTWPVKGALEQPCHWMLQGIGKYDGP